METILIPAGVFSALFAAVLLFLRYGRTLLSQQAGQVDRCNRRINVLEGENGWCESRVDAALVLLRAQGIAVPDKLWQAPQWLVDLRERERRAVHNDNGGK